MALITMSLLFGTTFNTLYVWYFLAALVAIIITYNYLKYCRLYNYWKDRNISGPKPIPYFGNSLSLLLTAKPYIEMQWYNRYGRLYGLYYMGKQGTLTVAEPALVKQILVREFDKFRNRSPEWHSKAAPNYPKHISTARDGHWRRLRLVMSPTFTSSKLKRLYPLVDECCQEFMAALAGRVSASSTGGRPTEVDLKQVMADYSMDVIASAAFATKIHPYSHPNHPFVVNANQMFPSNHWKQLAAMILPACVANSRLLGDGGAGQSSVAYFNDVVRRLISERKKSGEKHNDFLQLIMDAKREDGEGERVDTNGQPTKGKVVSTHVLDNKLSDNEIVGQCIAFIIGGYMSAMATLSHCIYELAVNTDIQDRLVAEITGAFADTTDIDYDTLCLRLPLLDAVLSETLRKYPMDLRLNRVTEEEAVLTASDGSTVRVEKGVMIEIPVYAIHHDPDHYPNPFAFKPDRFLPENRHHIKPYTYLPFGDGPRNCMGTRFALIEMKLLLVKMLRQFRFYAVPDTDVPLILVPHSWQLKARRVVVGVDKR